MPADQPAGRPLRVGIVGLGFGVSHHLPAWMAAGAEVVALCSARPGRGAEVAKAKGIAQGYDDWRVMYERADLDVVVVATRPDQHAEPVIAALERGLHVVCEKPMSASLDDAERMAAAAERAGGVSAIDFEFRLSGPRIALKRAVEAGRIGEVRSFQWNVRYSSVGRFESVPHGWLWEPAAGGLLLALGSHHFDTVRWIAGPFADDAAATRWAAVPRHSGIGTGADDAFTLTAGLAGGGGASVSFTPSHGFFESVAAVVGTEGTLLLDDVAQTVELHDGSRLTTVFDDATEPAIGGPDDLVPRVARFARLFIDAVHGTRSPDLATFRDGVEIQYVLDRATSHTEFPVRGLQRTRSDHGGHR
ncbi:MULTISPECIES: Gfo/Idh/MocA family protein [unclassified Pseudarthrobacter]|uniref:Gfo/Idh/MocA family protein n=1 Tax=unclassified Pseudarthrobacter TaxID=2647000 RepID=UPI003076FC0D